ncbi:MAG: YceI family protein [Proteobacteria bacterium]|nr:YceI family protein [Pseudomonadota bacterium]
MTRSLGGIILSALVAASAVAADTYTIDPRHTYPMFEVSHYGFSTQRGRFERTGGKISIDLESKTGSIEVKIDTASISMGMEAWNQQLRSDSYFNSEQFPFITFRSTHLFFDADRLIGAEGDFTLLGITRPLKLIVSNFHCGLNPIHKRQQCGADASTSIKRSEFGMTRALPGISDEVRILVGIEADKD